MLKPLGWTKKQQLYSK